jgi:hypothetical protein
MEGHGDWWLEWECLFVSTFEEATLSRRTVGGKGMLLGKTLVVSLVGIVFVVSLFFWVVSFGFQGNG